MSLPASQSTPGRRAHRRTWAAVGVLGEVLITLGVLLLLLVVYQLWWTNVMAERATDRVAGQLSEAWAVPPGESAPATPGDSEDPEFASAFALMYIPRISDSVWGTPVLEGVAPADLSQGIGHYPHSQMPGEVGNFAVAAHRATNGEPFRDIDRLQVGDEVLVETQDEWFVYRLEKDRIVTPQDLWVIEPVPGQPGATPTEMLITLTTCNPRWASYERWIWWGSLTDRIERSGDAPEAIRAGR